MNSNWDSLRARSKYHFDTSVMDPRWDTAVLLGRVDASAWQSEIDGLIRSSRPATWATRGYKGPAGLKQPDIEAEEYDLIRAGMDPNMTITHLNWEIPHCLKSLAASFELEQSMSRIHVQKPGEIWNLHIDKLEKWCPEDPDRVLRVFVQLTSWQPGQFWQFGNYNYSGWRAGDIITFDWMNVPHCTANAGYHDRITLQITGIKTSGTQEFLRLLESTL